MNTNETLRKILNIAICIALVVSFVPVVKFNVSAAATDLTVTIDTGASVTLEDADNDNYYEIGTADELYAFAVAVNGGNTAINGELIADITVNDNIFTANGQLNPDVNGVAPFRKWTPIGTASNGFIGTFDGAGYTVRGLYFNNSSSSGSNVGLLGYMNTNGKVKDVGVIKSYIRGGKIVGGVVGYNYGIVENCYSTGVVIAIDYYVGGVVGYNNTGTVENCYNTGSICGIDYYTGGVVGYNNNGTIESCYNTGSVVGNSNWAGGVVSFNTGTVQNCYNTGTVAGYSYNVGGVVGTNRAIVMNCYNTGDLTGRGYTVGGVVGSNGGTMENCYNTGSVAGGSSLGGVVGSYNSSTERNCYYLDTCGAAGRGTSVSLAQFESGEVTYLLQNAQATVNGVAPQIWGQDLDNGKTKQTSPTFTGAKVYYGYVSAHDAQAGYTNNSNVSADNHVARYDNGICTICGIYQEPTLKDGYNEISNAGQLYWFAEQVNSGDTEINGRLTADIIINPGAFDENGSYTAESDETLRDWTLIGTDTNNFNGTFDGDGYTVSGLYFNDSSVNYAGLLGYVGTNGNVKNVGVINSCIKGNSSVGGVVGNNYGIVENCYNTGAVTGSGSVGGVVGDNYGTVENCYNTGVVVGNSSVGGVVGYSNTTITNCYYLIGCAKDGNNITQNGIGNACEGNTTEDVEWTTTVKTAEQFASGEVAYLLQCGNTEQVWGQDNNQAGATPILTSNELYKAVKVGETDTYSVSNIGDTNDDGIVNVNDYQVLVNVILADNHHQIETESYDDIIKYDLDGDGYLDVLDATFMQRFINGFATIDVYAVGDYDQNGVAYEEADIKAIKHAIEKIKPLSTHQKYVCDVNGDGKVSAEDITLLTNIYGEIIATCEEYLNISYNWSSDYSACTATALCTFCGDVYKTGVAEVYVTETVASTCTDEGSISYEASFEKSDLFETQHITVAIEIDPNQHSFDNYVCSRCGLIDATDISVEVLSSNIYNQLECGEKNINIKLPADASEEIFTAIRKAIIAADVYDGSLNLTLSGVEKIPECAFYDATGEVVMDEIRSINLPDAIEIGESAFYSCAYLTSVSAPKAESVGRAAFCYCERLATCYFPGLKTIEEEAFSECGLVEISLPSVTEIGAFAFFYCENLETVCAPQASVIGQYAFQSDRKLTSLTVGALVSVEHSGFGIFHFANSTTNIDLTVTAGQKVLEKNTSNYWVPTETNLVSGTTEFMGYTFKSITIEAN